MSKTTLFDCKIKLIVDDLLKQVSLVVTHEK